MTNVLGPLIRAAILVAVTAAYIAVLNNSDTTDALGAGLLAFLILVCVAFGWALVDGVRRGFLPGLVVWLVTAAIAGVGIPAVTAIVNDDQVLDQVRESAVFFAILLLIPALAGVAIGAVVHKVRGGDEVTAAG